MRRQGRVESEWETPPGTTENPFKWEHVAVEVLMDIRAQLRRVNAVLYCNNLTRIPKVLDAISRNTKPQRIRRPARKFPHSHQRA